MATRAAFATVKGYYYQFEKTILEVLRLTGSGTSIIVEGIEDIDLNTATDTTAIQCKYLSAQKYTLSRIRAPIQLMLADHQGRSSAIKYQLYAHFKDATGLPQSLSVDELKELLTYTHKRKTVVYHRDNGVSEGSLTSFCGNLTIVPAKEFDQQHKDVVAELKSCFSCSTEEAECFFLNNGLRVVFDLASEKSVAKRQITRQDFIKRIDSRNLLFGKWLLQLKGREKYLALIRDNLKRCQALKTQKHKAVFLSADILAGSSKQFAFAHFVQAILAAYYAIGENLYDAHPWTVVIDADADHSQDLKASLVKASISYFDGFEDVSFSTELFDREVLKVKKVTPGGKVTEKLGNSSYLLRLIRYETYKQHKDKIAAPDVFFFFSDSKPTMIVDGSDCQIFRIDDITTLKEVSSVLIPT